MNLAGPRAEKGRTVGKKASAKTPGKLPRGAGVVHIEITKEHDWQEKVGLSPRDLINEIREVAGDEVASQVGSARVYCYDPLHKGTNQGKVLVLWE